MNGEDERAPGGGAASQGGAHGAGLPKVKTVERLVADENPLRRQQPDRFVHQNGPMINEFFPLLRFLFQHERAGREPNWSFEEQCVHPGHKPMTLATCW